MTLCVYWGVLLRCDHHNMYVEVANADEFIRSLPNGYDTVLEGPSQGLGRRLPKPIGHGTLYLCYPP